MKKITVLLLVVVCLFSASALAEGELKVSIKNLIIYAGEDNGYFFAKVENVGDAPISADTGDLVLFSTDDDIILSDGYITTSPSYVIVEPGDYFYVKEFIWDSALKDSTIGDYKFSMPAGRGTHTVTKLPCEASFDLEGADGFSNYIYVTFTNTSDNPLYDIHITAALYDAAGTLVFVDTSSLSSTAVHPGSTVTTRLYIDMDMMKHYQINGIKPTSVDAIVCYSAD